MCHTSEVRETGAALMGRYEGGADAFDVRRGLRRSVGHIARGRGVRRLCCAITAGLLLATGPVAMARADAAPAVRSQSADQMSSTPEVVYVNTVDAAERTQNFNEHWKFYLGEAAGAEQGQFDDSTWESVDLPHDYSIDQEYTKQGEAESAYKLGGIGWYRKSFTVDEALRGKRVRLDFDGVYMDATVWVNGHELGNHPYGYSPFAFDITDHLVFGGQNTIAVKVNHQTPSSRWYSGSGIGRDVELVVTDAVHVDRYGVVVTTPDLSAENKDKVKTHLKTTVVNKGASEAKVQVVQTVFPRGGSPEQKIAEVTSQETAIAAGKTAVVEQDATTTAAPQLWSTEAPNLYTVRTEIKQGGKVIDSYDADFGYRFYAFDANTGFSLNGTNVKLKGVSMHHDQGSLGAVASHDALERQIKILKEMGCNSIRSTHNPHSRELAQICNEQGILLVEEIFDGWTSPKNGNSNDYARFFNKPMGKSELLGGAESKVWAQFDLEQAVARDINAPSIIMWSLGNEMAEGTTGIANYNQVQKGLLDWVAAADPTRPATTGDNKLKGGSEQLNPTAIANAKGIVGANYMSSSRYEEMHKKHPDWKMYASETASATNSRGVYTTKANNTLNGEKLLTSYDKSAVSWGVVASEAWFDTVTHDYVAGEYVWTGFDYLGEPTPSNGVSAGAQGEWPSPKNSYFGIIDTAGLPKDTFYFYQSQWNESVNTLHILPAWNEDAVMTSGNNKEVEVVVYTDAPEVELFFTPAKGGETKSLGKKAMHKITTPAGHTYYANKPANGKEQLRHNDMYLTWNVPYADGTITAKAYGEGGKELDLADFKGRTSVKTAGKAAKISVDVDRKGMTANGTDLAYLTATIQDEHGVTVPTAKDQVTFTVEGAAALAGVDNGVQADHQSYRDTNRKSQAGQLVGIVRAGKVAGTAKVTVSASGLQPATVEIPVAADASHEGADKHVEGLFYARYHYVKAGGELTLPQKVEVRYSDGSKSEEAATWGSLSQEQLATPGVYTVAGTVADQQVAAMVTVIDSVAALQNYSTTIPVGGDPVLPTARPAVMNDGTVMNANFPVTWAKPDAAAYAKPGTVVVEGTASVFGVDTPVRASVRVQTGKVSIGPSVSSAAKLTQWTPDGQTNDTLNAIIDGRTELNANTGGGVNPSCWSNWSSSQAGHRNATLTFQYATQQTLGQINVFFGLDAGSGRYPDPNTITFEVSETGAEGSWHRLEARESIAEQEQSTNVKKYTYDFEPVGATFIRMNVVNSTASAGNSKPCTMITEVELKSATISYPVGSEAALEVLTVNDKELRGDALASGSYDTRAIVADVQATGKDNAAVTVLPAHDGAIKILIESENHAAAKVFTINLGADAMSPDLGPSDDARDYPVEKITLTGGNPQQPGSATEGPLAFAFDKRSDTHYHSTWNNVNDTSVFDKLTIDMQLAEPATIEALRYLPRQSGGMNGTLTACKVLWSEDGNTWHDAGSATWSDVDGMGWRIVSFDRPVTARYFRLDPVSSVADGGRNNYFVSAAEIRLRTARETIDIADESQVSVDVPKAVEVDRIDAEHPLLADRLPEKLTRGEKALVYGVDYLLDFKANDAAGMATVTIEGIGDYSGTVTRTFEIKLAPKRLVGIAVKAQPSKLVYMQGESFDPAGLVLALTYSNGETEDLAYSDATKGDFTFSPALGTAFDHEGTFDVTVEYQGHAGVLTVTVQGTTTPGGGTSSGGAGQSGSSHGGSGARPVGPGSSAGTVPTAGSNSTTANTSGQAAESTDDATSDADATSKKPKGDRDDAADKDASSKTAKDRDESASSSAPGIPWVAIIVFALVPLVAGLIIRMRR